MFQCDTGTRKSSILAVPAAVNSFGTLPYITSLQKNTFFFFFNIPREQTYNSTLAGSKNIVQQSGNLDLYSFYKYDVIRLGSENGKHLYSSKPYPP